MKYLLILLLLFSVAHSADLDSTRQARVAVYGLLGLDTTGTSNLPTTSVDFYVNQAAQKLNEDLRVYRRHDSLLLVDGTRFYALDSVLYVNATMVINGDSTYALQPVDIDTMNRKWEYDGSGSSYPEYYFYWGDSIGIIPTPRSGWYIDCIYTHQIPTDSLRIVPAKYRFGFVLYAAYLADKHVGRDGQGFYNDYVEFVNSKLGHVEPAKK